PGEDLLDLTAHLDLVRQVELRVEILDDAALDPELDVPERLARRQLGDEPGRGSGRRRATTAGGSPALGRRATATGCRRHRQSLFARATRPGGFDALEQRHLARSPYYRHAKSDLFLAATLAALSGRAAAVVGGGPVTALARRSMSCDTCASRL